MVLQQYLREEKLFAMEKDCERGKEKSGERMCLKK